MRTSLSSLFDGRAFGEQLAAEAHRKGFAKAKRKAFVADGMACNWTLHARHFADYVPIADFIHVIGCVYDAAVAVGGVEEFAWGMCDRWLTSCWQGHVSDIITELKTWQSQNPLPPNDETSNNESAVLSRDDQREIVRRTVVYLSNNQQRMNYPEYRRQGLPLTSALMESLVKEMNWRVKGTEIFWNTPSGAQAILALRHPLRRLPPRHHPPLTTIQCPAPDAGLVAGADLRRVLVRLVNVFTVSANSVGWTSQEFTRMAESPLVKDHRRDSGNVPASLTVGQDRLRDAFQIVSSFNGTPKAAVAQ